MATTSATMTSRMVSWLLRIGLASAFLYAGYASLVNPSDWIGYLPSFLTGVIAAATLLKIIAVYELILAVWLLSGMYVRYAAVLAALTLGSIFAVNLNQLLITFRDVGLIFAAAALAVLEW